MDDKDQKFQKLLTDNPQSETDNHVLASRDYKINIPVSPQQTNASSSNSEFTGSLKLSRKFYIYVAVAVLIIAALVGIIAAIPTPDIAKKSTTSSSSTQNSNTQFQYHKPTINNNNTINPTQNPLNTNGSINQQVQYCSNPINAATSC